MKIAICLSGQPRSIEFASKSALHHFQNSEYHTYDFFCHSWDYNTWKLQDISYTEPEFVDHKWLQTQLDKFNPIYSEIQSREDFLAVDKGRIISYGSLFYSMMKANHLKRKHEIENNFRYDCVFKIRFDSVFDPEKFLGLPAALPERTVYFPHLGRSGLEYNMFNASDCVFYGDSWGMDIMCDVFRYVLDQPPRKEYDYECYGPGTWMSHYGNNKNIDIQRNHLLAEIIYRKECLGLDPVDPASFQTIFNMHTSFYENRKY